MSEKTCNCDPCLEWLVPHDAEVTANERERIIKLLESNQVLKETKLKKWLFAQGFRFAIALIKGENK